MLKKLVIVGVLGFVAVSALKGTKIASYLRSEFTAFRQEVESQIPPEKEIHRLRNEVKLLDKDIMRVVNQLARERVEVSQLKDKIDELKANLGKEKELLDARAAAIKNATQQVTFGDRSLSLSAAKAELEAGVKRYLNNQKSLEGLEAAWANRVKVRDTLAQQLETMKNQKAELTATIDALEAELTALKLQQMQSKYQTDDTRLAQIKEDIRALRTKLEVEREKLKLMPVVYESGGVGGTGEKTVEEIMAPLSGSGKKSE
jgi:chromosome segregation ATPase